MLYNKPSKRFLFSASACFFLFLIFPFSVFSQKDEGKDAVFILKGNTRLMSGKSTEGVDMELKKDGQVIKKIASEKKGKYYLQMDVSTSNKNNEYLLYISQVGTVPKTLSINTYIPPEEFNIYSVPRYDFDLEIKMLETTVKDIVLERPSGKIFWSKELHAFDFDQEYAKLIQKDMAKLEADPDKYLKILAAKQKKEDEKRAKQKVIEDAKEKLKQDSLNAIQAAQEAQRKAEEEAAKIEADRILQQNLDAMKKEMRKKRMRDSLDSLAVLSAGKMKVDIKKNIAPVSIEDVDPNAFDGTGTYSINIAKQSLKATQEKRNKEKAANLSAKYETNNTLTSLLDMVDEHDKSQKLKSR